MSYRSTSYWFDSIGSEPEPRAPLPGDRDVDIVILGAGFSGLWTAYYLSIADPGCQIAVIERDIAGFGASGRNGGWCWPEVAGMKTFHAEDPEGANRLRKAIVDTVYGVGEVCELEGIEADYKRVGGIGVAADELQAARAREGIAEARAFGFGEDEHYWLEPDELQKRMRVATAVGATFQKHVAAVNPAKLARGLADAVERRGVKIYEQTTVTGVEPGRVQTSHGTVRASRIVMAMNAYKAELSGHKRDGIPVYENMCATEPLSDEFWEEIGLVPLGLFADRRRVFTYAQRTADNRIAIGGRTPRFHYGSRIDPGLDQSARTRRELTDALRRMFPQLRDIKITHHWGGPIAISRDMATRICMDPKTGIGGVGCFMGEGVAASNLAGRTLCDVLLERQSELTSLPWLGKPSPRWEPEPLRWLGVNVGIALNRAADSYEDRTHRPARLIDQLIDLLGMDV
ncbi:MAG: FAD-dependent oxidoreductase [Gammaproteobacteria bacterium]|nr:FAD-dependent oxidoreductase [Gammaproteobacteria bacterium]